MLNYLYNLSQEGSLITNEGKNIDIYRLDINLEETILNEWASHFRRQYCDDKNLSKCCSGTGIDKQEWLLKYKFPSDKIPPGPSTRAGDFGELLIADYIEYICSYYVPRIKYSTKINPNTSAQGSDVIGLKMGEYADKNDELYVVEVKTRASMRSETENRLQEAINDSSKDIERLGFSLSAIKQRLIELDKEEYKIIERFQNIADRPYKLKYGASAIYTTEMLDEEKIKEIKIPDGKNSMSLFIIHIDNLMNFINELYRRASLC